MLRHSGLVRRTRPGMTARGAKLRGAVSHQLLSQLGKPLRLSDLRHPAPEFEHEVEMIERKCLGPVVPAHHAITIKYGASGLFVQIIERLGDVHQWIA